MKLKDNITEENTEEPTDNIEKSKNEGATTKNLFKAKISYNLLKIAIGFIILSILFGVIGCVAKIPLLYIISTVILFIGLVTLLAWSIKKCGKKSNDIKKIDIMQNNCQAENKTKEEIKSNDRSNESEINTNSSPAVPPQISQNNVKE